MDRFSSLPDGLLLHVLRFLPLKSLLKCRQLSKKIRDFAQDNVLWKNRCIAEFGPINREPLARPADSLNSTEGQHGHEDSLPVKELQELYWLQRYQLNHGWEKGLCHMYRFEYPGDESKLFFEGFAYRKGKGFLLETACRKDCSDRSYTTTMLRVQEVVPNAASITIPVRHFTESKSRQAMPRHFILDSSQSTTNAVLMAMFWPDKLLKIFSFDSSNLSLDRVASHRLQWKLKEPSWEVISFHYPFLVVPHASLRGAGELLLFSQCAAPKRLLSVQHPDNRLVIQTHWGTTDEGLTLFLFSVRRHSENEAGSQAPQDVLISSIRIAGDGNNGKFTNKFSVQLQPWNSTYVSFSFPFFAIVQEEVQIYELVNKEANEYSSNSKPTRYTLKNDFMKVDGTLYRGVRIDSKGWSTGIRFDQRTIAGYNPHHPPTSKTAIKTASTTFTSSWIMGDEVTVIHSTECCRANRPSDLGYAAESFLADMKSAGRLRNIDDDEEPMDLNVCQSYYLPSTLYHDDERIVVLSYEQNEEQYWLRLQVWDFWHAVTDGVATRAEAQRRLMERHESQDAEDREDD